MADLDGVEAEGNGLLDGFQHALVAAPPRHALEAVRPQRVQADIDQTQPCDAQQYN